MRDSNLCIISTSNLRCADDRNRCVTQGYVSVRLKTHTVALLVWELIRPSQDAIDLTKIVV